MAEDSFRHYQAGARRIGAVSGSETVQEHSFELQRPELRWRAEWKGEWVDEYVYALLTPEWPAARPTVGEPSE